MARITYLQTNFSAGEMSPRMYGRVDVARYNNGVKIMENCHPVVHGGALGRYGTVFIAPLRDENYPARLVPFIYDRATAYLLEFGNAYMRVLKNGALVESSPGVPYFITTPYTGMAPQDFDYAHSADTMFMTQQPIFPQRLQRFGDASWVLMDVPFTQQPVDEVGFFAGVAATLSLATIGTGRTLTAAGAVFLASDVGREFSSGAGRGVITGYTSTTVVTVTITQAFASTSLSIGGWRIRGTPQTTCAPSAIDPEGATITLTLGAAGWRTDDVGKLVRLNGGLCRISGFTSTTVVNAVILKVLTATVAAEAASWTLEASAWSTQFGYPVTVTLYEQRLLYAGSGEYPQTIWGSRTGEPLNFTASTDDADAFSFTISSDQINPINYLTSSRTLMALTYGGEFTVQGGLEKPLAPTNVQVRERSNHGCGKIRPVRIREEELFVQRALRKIRALAYNVANDGYTAQDITLLAEHITEGFINDMAWQQEPEGILWVTRTDGVMLSVTFDREQEVTGWARHTTDGWFENVSAIPGTAGDDVYVVVRRTINGVTRRYIERMVKGVYPDCALVATAVAPGATVWTGLDHLEGKTVYILADGLVMADQVVTGGQVEIERPALSVQIGLRYQRRIECLTPEIQTGSGSAQGNAMATCEVSIRMQDTLFIEVNGQDIGFRQFGSELLDQAPEPFSGVKRVGNSGWARGESELVITQPDPLSFHVLNVIRKFTANG